MNSIRIFVGPSLAQADAKKIAGFDYRPPARRGEIHAAVVDGVSAIGLIDGYYGTVPAVLHREILFALSRGIPVCGAASIGAVRAAELAPFGMVGVGAIFEGYRSGELTGDDEVAILHAPEELGYAPLVDVLVNIRATLKAAEKAGMIGQKDAAALIQLARSRCFRERKFEKIVRESSSHGRTGDDAQRLIDWARANWVDQKALDAEELLRVMLRPLQPPPAVRFIATTHWRAAIEEAELFLT
ncbi:TfuA-like protein [Aquibium sp. LZ166]|uniref:TfuA-like protein n=1 Tax=Aquibium pacificus TaxID=3153579 RepID=A0ABV3SKL3_9HYPH